MGTPHAVVATYQPDTTDFLTSVSAAAHHSVTAAATSTALTAPATSVSGQSVSLVAVVTATGTPAVPTGTVTFSTNGNSLGSAALVAGTATLPVTTLPIGANSLTAAFAGDGDLIGSTSGAVAHTVSKAATGVGVASSLPTPVHGQPLTLTATVGVTAPGSGTPSGTIVFRDGTTVLGTVPLASGIAVLPLSSLPAGDRALTAAYGGDGRFLTGQGGLALSVAKALPVVTITSVSPTPSRFGSPVTIVATVVSPTGSTPTGEVAFSWGQFSNVVGRASVVNGVASLTTSDLSIARTIIGAEYLGDANHLGAFSPTGSAQLTFHTVEKAVYTVTVRTERTPTAFGERIHVLADAPTIGGRIPSGLVRFRVVNFGLAPPTTFDANGHAGADFDGVFPGDPRIIVNVDGDFWFEPSLGNEFTGHHVDLGTATVALTANPVAPAAGSATTLTATLGPAATAGIGRVRFLENGNEVARSDVDGSSKASASIVFPTAGPHVITASYDGGFGFFNPVSSAPLTVLVAGRPLEMRVPNATAHYGDNVTVDATLFTFDLTPPLPTGRITVTLDGQTIGLAGIQATLTPGVIVIPTAVNVGRGLEPGTHPIVVTYSGDTVFAPVTLNAAIVVSRRPLEVRIDPPFPNPATAGEPVQLSGRLIVPSGLAAPPTGTLTLGNRGTSCVVTLLNGATGASCAARFNGGTGFPEQVYAQYSGDARFLDSHSAIVELAVDRARPYVDLSAPTRDALGTRVWTDTEPVPVRWSVIGPATAVPVGRVDIWTQEGRQSCPTTATGTCDVRFGAPNRDGWIEARFAGDSGFEASVGRSDAPVVGCYSVAVFSPGRTTTAPNCGVTRYISGTRVDLLAPAPTGYSLAGWSGGPGSGPLQSSPVWVFGKLLLGARFMPVCFTLRTDMRPFNLPRIAPDPAPNCDDAQAPDFSTPDLAAIRRAEVSSGSMRYRAGTRVTLPSTNMVLNVPPNGLLAAIRWSGDGVGADRVVTLDRDRAVVGQLDLPCRRFVVDGPPGSKASVVSSVFDTSKSALLGNNYGGICTRADGSPGYIAGTTLRLALTPPTGTWFDHWGSVERLAGHRAPSAVTALSDRPATTTSTGATTVVVPDYDAALSGFAAGVSCFELRINLKDAVTPGNLVEGSKPPTVDTTAPNCPTWWLQEHNIATTPAPRWYLAGTEATVTASEGTRRGYVDEFSDAKQIFFRRWSGGIKGDAAVQKVVMNGTVDATAEWYVAARCGLIILRPTPAASGEVIMSDVGTECPAWLSGFANVPPTPRAPLGSPLSLAAKPKGALQTIWQVEGPSVTNTEQCKAREKLIADRRADGATRGKSQAEVDQILMDQGYLPGGVLARIQQEAAAMFAKGWTQANIVEDLKTMGLLDASGAPVPDRLRENPCDHQTRDTVLPAGQRSISMKVDGDVIATAWFCQAVVPSVTVIDIEGKSAPATGAVLDSFGPVFRSSDNAVNCPTPGWFLPNTTPVLGANGTGVPGYAIEGWTVDGVPAPAGPLSVPITQDGPVHKVALTVRVQCRTLKVTAPFGFTASQLPNCPGVSDASRNLYALGSKVTVGAGENGDYVWQQWSTGSNYNPTLVTMNDAVTMEAQFRHKTVNEKFTETVLDPAINAMGVAAKKVVGGLAYATKFFAQRVIDDIFLKGLSLIGTVVDYGFGALGVHGKVLDGIVLGLQTPSNTFEAGLAGFDCVEEWAWGRTVPTLEDLKDLAVTTARGAAIQQVQGVSVDQVVTEGRALAAKIASGDPSALSIATVAAGAGGAPAMALVVALDIGKNPDKWKAGAIDAGNYALTLLQEQFGKPFTWETSAGQAWSSGGDAFLACMAKNGKAMAGK
jgi:hypothetical protein